MPSPPFRHIPWLGLVLLLATSLRVAHVLALRGTVWFDALVVDPAYYDLWAQQLAAGDWIGEQAFYMDPLYPYGLGLLYRFLGRDLLVVRLIQVGLSVATCALVARLGTRLGGRAIGIGGALLFALYKPEIFYTAEIEKTCLSVFLVAAGLTLFFERPTGCRFASGLAFGLGTLTRANLLLLVPAAVLALGVQAARGRRRALLGAGLFLVGFGLALAPVAWRNHRVAGTWVLTTTQGGQNFYMGNNPDNLSGSYGTLPFLRPNPAFEETDFRAEAERRIGRPLDAGATSRFWYGEALRFIRDRPATAVRLLARKLALVWNDYEISDNQDQYLLARDSWVMRLPLPGFGAMATLAALGTLAAVAASGAVRLLLGFVVLYGTSVAAFFVFSRYRIQLLPALAPLAALGVREIRAAFRDGPTRRRLRDAAVGAACAAFTFQTIPPFFRDHPQVNAMRLRRLADAHLVAADPDRAIVVLTEAIGLCPERCPAELDALIDLLSRRGRSAEAAALIRDLARSYPHSPVVTERLRRVAPDG